MFKIMGRAFTVLLWLVVNGVEVYPVLYMHGIDVAIGVFWSWVYCFFVSLLCVYMWKEIFK